MISLELKSNRLTVDYVIITQYPITAHALKQNVNWAH